MEIICTILYVNIIQAGIIYTSKEWRVNSSTPIHMKEQIEEKDISEEELQRIYAEFKEKVESDVKAQKELVYKK